MRLDRLNSKSVFLKEEEIPIQTPPKPQPLSKGEMQQQAWKAICMTIGFYPDLREHAKEVITGIKKIADHMSQKYGLRNLATESVLLEVRIQANNPTMGEYIVMLQGVKPDDPRFGQLVRDFNTKFSPAWSQWAKENYQMNLSLNRSVPGGTFDPLGWKRDNATGKLVYTGQSKGGKGQGMLGSITDVISFFKDAVEFGSYMWGVIEKLAAGEPFSNISKFAEQYAKWRENPDEPFDIDPMMYLTDEERKAVEEIRNRKEKEQEITPTEPTEPAAVSEPEPKLKPEPTAKDAEAAAKIKAEVPQKPVLKHQVAPVEPIEEPIAPPILKSKKTEPESELETI